MDKNFIRILLLASVLYIAAATSNEDVLVLTLAGPPSDSKTRFLRSAEIKKYQVQELGTADQKLTDEQTFSLVKEALDKIANDIEKKIVLFLDGPDVILSAGPLRVVEEMTRDLEGPGGQKRVLVSGDSVCWPDKTKAAAFPKLEMGKRFLDSGAFVGEAAGLSALFAEKAAGSSLQEAFTSWYTDPLIRKKHRLAIDSTADMFQNLDGATGDLDVRFAGKEGYLQNTAYASVPLVIRGNRNTKQSLNTFSNYLAKGWNPEDGCRECWEGMQSLDATPPSSFPLITLAVFVPHPIPFLEEFLWKIKNQTYPKDRIDLFFHNNAEFHAAEVSDWLDTHGRLYRSMKLIEHQDPAKDWHAKDLAVSYCEAHECDFLLVIDGHAHLDNPFVFKLLVEQNRGVLAPMLARPHKAWSNFWGALTQDEFYSRSFDYVDIVQNTKRGLWNVPYIGNCYMVRRDVIKAHRPVFINKLLDADMAFCANMRANGVHLLVTNRLDMGHLVSSESFVPTHFRPELWEMFENRWDWEARYLHVNFSHGLQENATIAMPCPDVYWFPVFTERFAQEYIDVNENYGKWSDGSHSDVRLEGGYETVPTVDIHTNQINYRDEWLEILRAYIQPLQLRVFDGYNNDVGPPQALMAFTVRYKPDEQPFLRPHHDTSTYTINVALNRPEIDYQGGGVRFVRYNCSVLNTRVGWILMHPGRLTHLHEGLQVTGGTRYITVTFIDP